MPRPAAQPRWDPAAPALSEVSGMDETPRLLLTLTGNRPGMMFPKRRLGDPAAVPRLREYLAARVGPRATRAGGAHTTPSA
jgi:hypothetical protein